MAAPFRRPCPICTVSLPSGQEEKSRADRSFGLAQLARAVSGTGSPISCTARNVRCPVIVTKCVNVLLIEPDMGDCALLRYALDSALKQLRIECVGDAAAFGAIQNLARFDLVVTCWKLPWTTARTVIRLVKAEAPSCPVLVIGAPVPFVLDFADVVRSAGADRYAPKSATMEAVRDAVRALLA
jgi:CheY-like chemotaxis protein